MVSTTRSQPYLWIFCGIYGCRWQIRVAKSSTREMLYVRAFLSPFSLVYRASDSWKLTSSVTCSRSHPLLDLLTLVDLCSHYPTRRDLFELIRASLPLLAFRVHASLILDRFPLFRKYRWRWGLLTFIFLLPFRLFTRLCLRSHTILTYIITNRVQSNI